MALITGAPIVPGLAVGRAVLLVRRGRALRAPVAPAHVDSELRRLEGARERTREQLAAIRARLAAGRGADLARMFDAQLLMLDDPLLVGRAVAIVTGERVNAEWAIQRACDEVGELFAGIDDEYLRERGGDVADLVGRLRMNLQGTSRGWHELLAHGDGPFVVVADDPPPSVAAQLDWSVVSGLAIDAGSRTSHTAILARSLGIPTVVGLRTATSTGHARPPRGARRRDGGARSSARPTPSWWRCDGARRSARPPRPPSACRPSAAGPREMACASGSRPTSTASRTWRPRAGRAPKASGCSDPSSCCAVTAFRA